MEKVILALLLVNTSLFCQRYTDSLFIPHLVDANVTYAATEELNSPYFGESFTHNTELKLDLYEPQDDTLSFRPVIINIHGGAFQPNPENDSPAMR